MKKFMAGFALGISIFSLAGFAYQSLPSNGAVGQDHIWLGANLTLGASEADVRKALAQYDFRKSDGNEPGKGSWLVTPKGKPSEILGVVTFKEEKLHFVTKRWLSRPEDQEAGVQTANAVYGVLSEFVKQGETSCSVSTDHQASPNLSTKIATIRCGEKRLEILVGSKPGEPDTVDINESLQ